MKLTLWTHDQNFSRADYVVSNQLPFGIGDILSVNQRLFLRVSEFDTELLARQPQLQISLASHLAQLLELPSRSNVTVERVENWDAIEAQHVEITFKDQYIGRGDMFRLKNQLLQTCIYTGQKILSSGCIRAHIKEIYSRHGIALSALVTKNTKIIFRSESAKYFIFIQVSSDLFEVDGSLMRWEKAMDRFLPELFRRWKTLNTNHVVSIVLFSRVYYSEEDEQKYQLTGVDSAVRKHSFPIYSGEAVSKLDYLVSGSLAYYKDFYKVIVDWETRQDWSNVVRLIREEAWAFRQTVLTRQQRIVGDLAPSYYGNVLESVNLALNIFSKHYVDRDLARTGLSIVVVSATSGMFHVPRDLLRLTTERMMEDGIGLDLVCLNSPPLYCVPLFHAFTSPGSKHAARARGGTSDISRRGSISEYLYNDVIVEDDFYTLPHWIDISFVHDDAKDPYRYRLGRKWPIRSMKRFQPKVAYMTDPVSVPVSPSVDQASSDSNNMTFSPEKTPPKHAGLLSKHLGRQRNQHTNEATSFVMSMSSAGDSPAKTPVLSRSVPSDDERYSQGSHYHHHHPHGIVLPSNLTMTSTEPVAITRPTGTRYGSPGRRSDIARSWKASFVPPSNMLSNSNSGASNSISPGPQVSQGFVVGRSTAMTTFIRPKSIDPCSIDKSVIVQLSGNQVRRWNHIFPKKHSASSGTGKGKEFIKWTSLCTPACLPLTTDFFPAPDELVQHYQEYTYTVSLNPEDLDGLMSDDLQIELISQRLMQGFQLVVGLPDDEKSVTKASTLIMGNQIHRLQCDATAENIEVKRFVRRQSYSTDPIDYACAMWTKYRPSFLFRQVHFEYPSSSQYNWNYLDHVVSGYQDELTESLRFWRSRFILIPMETLPQNMYSTLNPTNETLTDEELRLAGFMKFIELFNKARWIPPEERSNSKKRMLTANNIPITFTTFNTSTYVANEVAKWNMDGPGHVAGQHASGSSQSPLAPERLTKDIKMSQLASAMQHPIHGVSFKDRRWHLRFYERVFIGHECVDWLIKTFTDISTRDEAVEFGQYLLQQGLFRHVNSRHQFLDGHYFYRMNPSYMIRDKDEARTSTMMRWFRVGGGSSNAGSGNANVTSNQQAKDEPSPVPSISHTIRRRPKIELTRKLRIDVDVQRKSGREEWAILHYDTVHNPSNCYHFSLHWLVCTSRLVEDLLQAWSRTAEKCGLRMIEAPVEQAQNDMVDDNPFSSPVEIELCLPPPKIDREELSYRSIQIPDLYFEHELIKHFGFTLDVESDDKFPIEHITHSFKQPTYRYTQYVHRTGVAFLQLTGRGFVWVHNRLISRSSDSLRQSFESFCSSQQELSRFWTDTMNKLLSERAFLDDIIDDVAQHDQQLKLIPIEETPPIPIAAAPEELARTRTLSVGQDDKEPRPRSLSAD